MFIGELKMDTLMSKIRTALEGRTDVVILDEFATKIDNPQAYLNQMKLLRTGESQACPSGSFIVAPKPGIYYIKLDKEKYLSEQIQTLGQLSVSLQEQIDLITGKKKSPRGYYSLNPNLDIRHIYGEKFLCLFMENINQICDLGTVKVQEKQAKYDIKINPLFRDLFPKDKYQCTINASPDSQKELQLRFALDLYVWLNPELYQLQKEAMKSAGLWKEWLRIRGSLEKGPLQIYGEEGDNNLPRALLSRRLIEYCSVDVCAFNQYFQKHSPKEKR
jgi:hypothetical protein